MRHALIALLSLASIAGASCGGQDRQQTTSPCPSTCKKCDAQKGCMDCTPGQDYCDGDSVIACNADGTVGATVKTCDTNNNEKCMAGHCLSPCDVAAGSHSYIGCDYWPVTLLNAELDPLFDFAVAVANPLQVGDVTTNGPARVKIVQGNAPCDANGDLSDGVAFATVSPGQVKTLLLPWVPELSQNLLAENSVISNGGAYHLCSSLPVTVYQFNPLQFQKPATKCQSDPNPMAGQCHSYTNDASILLPTNALQRDYVVASYGSFGLYQAPNFQNPKPVPQATPGFFAVVATQDNTNVTVTYTAYTGAGVNLDEQKPGDKVTYQLNTGDVLQVISKKPRWDPKNPKPPCVNSTMDFQATYCDLGPQYDLTGSQISADKPIAVFGGHSCAFVPYDKWACDHLEEQLIPLDTWGKETVAVQTPPSQMGEPNMFRIISGSANTTITVDPASVLKPTTLDLGQYVDVVVQGGFQATATTPDGSQPRMLVAQYMVGGNYIQQFNPMSVGDPSLGFAVPTEQFRKSYDFLTPETYTQSFVTVIGMAGASFTLDGMGMSIGFNQTVGNSGYAYEFIELMPGAHHISADEPFGINVSGLAAFTSYLYPGGLNLFELNPQ